MHHNGLYRSGFFEPLIHDKSSRDDDAIDTCLAPLSSDDEFHLIKNIL